MTDTPQTLIEELRGDKCRCGAAKEPKHTFCRACYFKLPRGLRSALYRLVGDGYEKAYAAAVAALSGGASQPPRG